MPSLCLLTPTWAPDATHFSLLRASIEQTEFASIPHYVVAQSEDIEAFRRFDRAPVILEATGDVLPARVEADRRRAQRLHAWSGRALTRVLGSLSRRTGWPSWVGRTGWHVQQITKLAFVAASDVDHVVCVDSDLVFTRHSTTADFVGADRIVCFSETAPRAQASRKVVHWNEEAEGLFGGSPEPGAPVETYFDTPFVFHAPTVREMLAWLENRYQLPWWEALLRQPPRRWSEFGIYRAFLRRCVHPDLVEWRSAEPMRYLFDASDPDALSRELERLIGDPGTHYVTIHSQSSGRRPWSADDYAHLVRPLLDGSSSERAALDGRDQ